MNINPQQSQKLSSQIPEIQLALHADTEEIAQVFRDLISNVRNDVRISWEEQNCNNGWVKTDDKAWKCKLVTLPCITELYKTVNNGSHFKCGDIGQMLYVGDNAWEQPNQWPDGLTPPTKAIHNFWSNRAEKENCTDEEVRILNNAGEKILAGETLEDDDDEIVEFLQVDPTWTDEQIVNMVSMGVADPDEQSSPRATTHSTSFQQAALFPQPTIQMQRHQQPQQQAQYHQQRQQQQQESATETRIKYLEKEIVKFDEKIKTNTNKMQQQRLEMQRQKYCDELQRLRPN
eukprot:TRINITY_DN67512_c3_g1_i1.p1 TRINITY_DN67512_c3_g1~~TRINITY_DN67512_c3_g1_i1.p1  ORF type:complete len:289 (+),score=37.74 TRINITY_DN67512_c3_g1_i1:54-920(+)